MFVVNKKLPWRNKNYHQIALKQYHDSRTPTPRRK
jgi:hypothetical protein